MKELTDNFDPGSGAAKTIFARYLKVRCEACGAPEGDLCYSDGVWIHLERFNEVDSPRCPECKNGKCQNCGSKALNVDDFIVPCKCNHNNQKANNA